ncbi:MAG: GNAT family N-acetyltransferase [Chlorobi bacterium]|nr:GNAT family N-acetyltransferase [Chlorobiota bacterium]
MKNCTQIIINTARLQVYPLPLADLRLLIESPMKYAQSMKLNLNGFCFNANTIRAIKTDLLPHLISAKIDWYYYTMWLMVQRRIRNVTGSFCFYGKPDSEKNVEIGYGVNSVYQNKGFMAEALKGIINFCVNEDIKFIKARCNLTNKASNRVLEKSGFSLVCMENELNTWKLSINKTIHNYSL